MNGVSVGDGRLLRDDVDLVALLSFPPSFGNRKLPELGDGVTGLVF